mgnify:CR=1 FL=1
MFQELFLLADYYHDEIYPNKELIVTPTLFKTLTTEIPSIIEPIIKAYIADYRKVSLSVNLGLFDITKHLSLKLALHPYTLYEKSQASPDDIPAKLVLTYHFSNLNLNEILLSNAFKRKNLAAKNSIVKNFINYSQIKLPLSPFLEYAQQCNTI